ncbi:MAG: ubiquitin-like domain-containing protein, partial [Oscillospiraceae bacterium]
MFERLKGRVVKASLSAKSCIAMTLCSAFVVSTCCGFAYATPNLVTIYDAEKAPIHVKTTSASVGKILSKQGIVLNNGDKMNIALNDKIANDTIIEIYRANKVKVNYLGETKEYETTKTLVSDVLYEIGIEVDDNDSITPRLTDTVENGDEISIVVSESQKVVVQEDI